MPEKKKDREQLLLEHKDYKETLIFYSAPHDIKRDLTELYGVFGNRQVAVVKEITKIHESVYRTTLAGPFDFEDRGEFVIVVEGSKESEKEFLLSVEEHISLYISRGMTKKEAIKQVAKERGLSKNELYKYTIND